jgi:carbamoyl-phosphate synthase large subunit
MAVAKVGARCMAGQSLASQGITKEIIPPYFSVKEVVIPFNKFPGVDPILGPEMRSTGEVMGVGDTFAEAFAKAELGAGTVIPTGGRALLSVRDSDKVRVVELARTMVELGFELDATGGTAKALEAAGIECRTVSKVFEGRPHILDRIKNGEYSYIVNTTEGRQAIEDSKVLRRGALQHKANYTTTLNAAFATCKANAANAFATVASVQELHKRVYG